MSPMTPARNLPLVTLLLWSDNRADMLAASLDSLLAQTYANTEILVIDNASTDDSGAIADDYAGRHAGKIRVSRLAAPAPRIAAECEHRHLVNGEFLAFASAGSRSAPERIAAGIDQLLTTPNLGGVCSRIAVDNAAGLPFAAADLAAINEGDVILRRRLPREGNVIDTDTAMLRSELFRKLPFNPALVACGHLPLWLHVLDDSELLRIDEVWVKHQRATEAAPVPTLAEARDTVACIVAALRRWKLDQYFRFSTGEGTPERQIEEAVAEAQLALQLIELDRRFFGRPAIGCHEAYFHALRANALAPLCLEAQAALRVVRRTLGEINDSPDDSPGGRPRTLADWQAKPLSDIPPSAAGEPSRVAGSYRQWKLKHALRDIDGEYFGEHLIRHWRQRPDFIVLELPGPRRDLPERVAAQFYPPLHAVTAPAATMLEAVLQAMPRHQLTPRTWLLLLPHGAALAPETLIRLGDAISLTPTATAWYADDEVAGDDSPTPAAAPAATPIPRFKPDTDPLLLQGCDYLGAVAFHLDAIRAQAGEKLDDASAYSLALELVATQGREALGHVQEVLFSLAGETTQAAAGATAAALARHLGRHRPQATLTAGPVPHTFRWQRRPQQLPSLSLIIVPPPGAGQALAGLERLLTNTAYTQAEILLCDESGSGVGIAIPGLRTVPVARGASLAEKINLAAQAAVGDYLLLVSAASVPQRADWLETAVALAVEGDYGAVGVAGLDPESGRYWGTGTIVGIGGGFDGLHATALGPEDAGHLNRAALPHEASAVSADGLLTPRALFVALGGFDAQWQLCSAMVTDYCLRLQACGRRIAWTPQAVLERDTPDLPETPPPVDAQIAARDRFIGFWLPRLAADPYWNRHLSLLTPVPEPEADLVLRWTPEFHDRLRVLALPMPASGQAEYRVTAPLRALDNAGLAQTMLACEPLPGRERAPIPSELARLAPDTLYLQAAFDDVRFNGILACARFNPGIFRIFSLDDRISDMPAYNASSKALPRDLVMRRMREALRHCNRLVVSTEPLAELYRNEIDDIVVVPNRLEKARWGGLAATPPGNPDSRKPRVGWAGALQHAGDLAMIREVVETLAGEVDWVFFGMIPAGCEPFIKEFHGTVHLDDYPAKLASLALDLALAPLEVNLFNESKSNLRLIEYGIFGWPVVCTDIYPFRTNDAPVCRVPNEAGRWIAAIREHLADRTALRQRGRELQAWVHRHYLLEDHLDDWLSALKPV